MKQTSWLVGCWSMLTMGTWGWHAGVVQAQCIQADISVQYNISGSREPTERENEIDLQSEGACHGNASVTTGVQGNVGGTRRVRQSRKVRHRFVGAPQAAGSSDRVIQIKSNPQIDVYNAADQLDY